MESLTRDEVLNIIVALDNESYHEWENNHQEQSNRLRDLKWKMFKILTEMEKSNAQ